MADDLRKLRLDLQLPAKDIVAVVQRLYPSFDKSMLSKSENGDKYGVTLKRDAVDAIVDEFAPEAKKAIAHRRNGYHRLTCRITCRLENDEFDLLQQLIKDAGYKTTQDWLSDMVKQYIKTQNLKGATTNDS